MSARHILGGGVAPKGSAVRRLKWHASWVQNVVETVRSLTPPWAKDTSERSCP